MDTGGTLGTKKLLAGAAVLVASALAFAACTPPTPSSNQTALSQASTISVMWNQPFYSGNGATAYGNATSNNNILYLTNDSISYYDKDLNLVSNKSFGSYEKTSDSPLSVKQTVADTATWSDGTPVTAADFILAYGAQSGLFNNYTAKLDPDTGNVAKDNSGTKVFFNSSNAGWALIKKFPVVAADNKSFTYEYSKPFADWEKNLFTPGLPAHIIGKIALGISDPTQAAQAVLDAFKNKDNAALSKISNSWNSDWNFTQMPTNKDLLVGSGAYTISDFKKDQYLTLTKNANYKGEHPASIDAITIRYNEDPQAAVQALQNGEVQLISPQATQDVSKQLQAIQGVTVKTGLDATFEHIDLVFNNGGPFDPKTYGGDATKAMKVREAFLLTIPRQKIVDTIIKPLNADAAVRNSFTQVPGSPNYTAVSDANGMGTTYASVDLAKAKQLLAEAGVTSPSVRMLYAKGNQRREQEFQLIKESAEQAGFKMVNGADANWGAKLSDTSKYDSSLFGWQSVSTAVSENDANYRTGGQNNFGGYTNKKVDQILDELQVTIDPAKQTTLLGDLEKQLVDDAFGVSVFQFPAVTAYSSKLSGIDPSAIAPTIFWNFWEWKI